MPYYQGTAILLKKLTGSVIRVVISAIPGSITVYWLKDYRMVPTRLTDTGETPGGTFWAGYDDDVIFMIGKYNSIH